MGTKSKRIVEQKQPYAPQAEVLSKLLPAAGDWFADPNTKAFTGVTPEMQRAWDYRANIARNIIPQMAAQAQQGTQFFTSGEAFKDPTLSPGIDAATRGTKRQFLEQMLPQLRSNYAGGDSGYGGSRMARDQTLATSGATSEIGRIGGDLAMDSYGGALRGLSGAAGNLPDIAKMGLLGGTIMDDLAKQESGFNVDPELAKMQAFSKLISMQDYGGNSNQYTSQSGGQAQAILGAVAAAYSIYSALASYCWVADAIYGKDSNDAKVARYWVTVGWKGKTADAARWIYKLIGPNVAKFVHKSSVLKRLLRPLFNVAVKNGKRMLAESMLLKVN